jgi:hypothetical protein
VKLLGRLLDSGERRRGKRLRHDGNGSGRSFGRYGFSGERRLRLGGKLGHGGHLNRGSREPWRAGLRWHRNAVGLRLEPDPVVGKGTGPIGGTHPSAREKGEGGRSGPCGEGGPGRSCWAARRGRKRGEERRPRAGLRRERRSGLGQLGRA